MAGTVSVELEAREFEWEFASGQGIRGFGLNGEVPGPMIEADVGDTIEVRLINNLPQATTIHWHGIRLPAEMDGTDAVQAPVEPVCVLGVREPSEGVDPRRPSIRLASAVRCSPPFSFADLLSEAVLD